MTKDRNRSRTDLNGICPYFTMFPLDFPLEAIRRRQANRGWVLDPFCGRGTTNFAARLCGVSSIGLDSNPLATAIAKAKAAVTSAEAVISATERILRLAREPDSIPHGSFWRLAFHETTLRQLCIIREALRRNCAYHILENLTAGECAGRLVSRDAAEWLYVFKPRIAGIVLYVKVVLRADCVVISFHEERGNDDQDQGEGQDA